MENDFNDGCKKEKKKRVKDILESREGARWKNGVIISGAERHSITLI
jgi:hypothetical protein